MGVGTVVQGHHREFATTHNRRYSNNIPAEQKHAVRGYILFKHQVNGVRGESQLSHTRRIYNNAKRWWHNKVVPTTNDMFGGMHFERKFEPFRQHIHMRCHCSSWCRLKTTNSGALRIRRKQYIELELKQCDQEEIQEVLTDE
jgi:hypothetical protein